MTHAAIVLPSRITLPRRLLAKAAHHHDGMYAHSAGYFLLDGRWHALPKNKPAPKGASIAAHPKAAGHFEPAKHFSDEQWQALKLPDNGTGAAAFNRQLQQVRELSEAGDVTGLLGMPLGHNPNGKRLSKVVNFLLNKHGSEHSVAPGQEAGAHSAVQVVPEDAATDSAHADNNGNWVMPIKDAIAEHKDLVSAAESPSKADDKAELAEQKAELARMQTTASRSGNAGTALDQLIQPKKALQGKIFYEWFGDSKVVDAAGKPLVVYHGTKSNFEAFDTSHLKSSSKHRASDLGFFSTVNPEIAAEFSGKFFDWDTMDDGYKDGANLMPLFVSIKNPVVLTANEFANRFITGDESASSFREDAQKNGHDGVLVRGDAEVAAKLHTKEFGFDSWVAFSPSQMKSAIGNGPDRSPKLAVQRSLFDQLPASDVPPYFDKLDSIPWGKMLLPDTNTNAGTNNRGVARIKALAYSGNLAALKNIKFGIGTYGKRRALLRDTVVAAIEQSAPKLAQVEQAAHEAATSPHNDTAHPSDAQVESGNYKKGHIKVAGLDVTIENPRGSVRSGTGEDGSKWSNTMSHHYGYIKRTTGADGDNVDVFVGPHVESDKVFVVDQLKGGKADAGFDEHKVMLGFADKAEAVAAYRENYEPGWRVGPVTEMTAGEFKDWLKDGDTGKAVADTGPKDGERNAEGLVFRDGRWHRDTPDSIHKPDMTLDDISVGDLIWILRKPEAGLASGFYLSGVVKAKTARKIDIESSYMGKPQLHRGVSPFSQGGVRVERPDGTFLSTSQRDVDRVRSKRMEQAGVKQEPAQIKVDTESSPPTIIEHTTAKGKTLRGVVRQDLTKEQAQAIDAYTFKKDGGWFIREKHLQTAGMLDAAKDAGTITPEQHEVARTAAAEGGAAAAAAELKKKQQADKLRLVADSIGSKADAEMNRERVTNTARRARMAGGAIQQAEKDAQIAQTIRSLADAIEAGQAPALVGIRSAADVRSLDDRLVQAAYQRDRSENLSYAQQQAQRGRAMDTKDILHAKLPASSWGNGPSVSSAGAIELLKGKRGAKELIDKIRYSAGPTTEIIAGMKKHLGEKETEKALGWYAIAAGKTLARFERMGIKTDADLRSALMEYLEFRGGAKKEDPVKAAERALVGKKVGVDFFPTPKTLASRMAEMAGIKPGMEVLEPSAGNGNLADAASAAGAKVEAVEVSEALRNVLSAKGHTLAGRDFEEFEPGKKYDAVLMNPPFSDRKDAAHIMRAWDMVKPGGTLVAIAGEGVFFGSDKKAVAFREWLDAHGATVEKLPEGTFQDKSLLATTGANARLVVLEKPAAAQGEDKPAKEAAPVQADTPKQDAGPQEGDVNADGLVFRDGRWHREGGVASAPPAQQTDSASTKPITNTASGTNSITPPAGAEDPNSPDYRFADTGYIAGSRKEEAAANIKSKAKDGLQVRVTDVDWSEIEKNPREARELIRKSNLFGKVDWPGLREGGMEPGAGFLVDRVYASVPQEPDRDSPQKRQDYALALESLRDRMERCKTPADVVAALNEIRDELSGSTLTAEQSAIYNGMMDQFRAARKVADDAKSVLNAYAAAMHVPASELSGAKYEQQKRVNRGWKPDPALAQRIEKLQAEVAAATEKYNAYREAHPELISQKRELPGGWTSYENDLEHDARKHSSAADEYMKTVRQQNLLSNPTTRAWITLGDKFLGVLNYRSSRGSQAFAGHVSNARNGKISDWSWAEKEGATVKRATKREVSFQLKVVDKYERAGGRAVSAASTAAFKDQFGLRDVQSGNWVLNDPESAAWHVQQATEAFADLADLLGAKDEQVSMKGRLAMAFGARGRGNAGSGGVARAHYEPVHRVINLTKMGGGGTLAHEWAHALDNLCVEAEGGDAGADAYASENPSLLPPGPLRDAFKAVRSAMLEGSVQATQKLAYTGADVQNADYNINRSAPNAIAQKIKAAGNADAAVNAMDQHFGDTSNRTPRYKKMAADWRRLAAAYYGRNPEGGEVMVKAGPTMSAFAAGAKELDGSGSRIYWSATHEMFARAFQSYCEDKLGDKGRRSDYLSAMADNKHYVDPIMGVEWKPFPEGDERKRINAAFDGLVGALSASGTLAKAMALAS